MCPHSGRLQEDDVDKTMVGRVGLKRRTNMVPTSEMCRFHNPDCPSIAQHPKKDLSEEWLTQKLSSPLQYRAFDGLAIADFLHEGC